MGNLKKGWYVCESNFIQWRKNYRIWMIVAIETILIFRYLHGLSEYGQATGKTITPFVLPIVFAEAENSNGLLKVLRKTPDNLRCLFYMSRKGRV